MVLIQRTWMLLNEFWSHTPICSKIISLLVMAVMPDIPLLMVHLKLPALEEITLNMKLELISLLDAGI